MQPSSEGTEPEVALEPWLMIQIFSSMSSSLSFFFSSSSLKFKLLLLWAAEKFRSLLPWAIHLIIKFKLIQLIQQ